jgi:thaumarchaeosortase
LWLFVLETFNPDQATTLKTKSTNKIKTAASIACALIPIVYIVAVNFLGLGQNVLDLGEAFRGEYWRATTTDWIPILEGAWPLLVEYCVFTFSFLAATLLAYGKAGLKNYAITLGLIVGITTVYALDTLYPYGLLRPLQMIALPTAACAAAVLELIGYSFSLSYIPGANTSPVIRSFEVSPSASVNVVWPCAGVHSLFLYTLIILLLFKKSEISSFRKLSYFIVGAIGTYLVNVLRIVSYFVILSNDGLNAAITFHDVHGELYSVVWILSYILLVVCIQHFMLIEKFRYGLHVLGQYLRITKNKDLP